MIRVIPLSIYFRTFGSYQVIIRVSIGNVNCSYSTAIWRYKSDYMYAKCHPRTQGLSLRWLYMCNPWHTSRAKLAQTANQWNNFQDEFSAKI